MIQHLDEFTSFGTKSKSSLVTHIDKRTAVVYTRVSTKEQSDHNLSLSFQRRTIEEYAERCGLTIVEFFGGTYESAKTDGRKEFMRMLDFLKKNKGTISHLLVYTLDRFSRTGGAAIKLAQELREKQGVNVFAVTQPTDTSNPSGVLHQNMQLLFSEFDNQLRRQRAVAGMREKVNLGIWIGKPPQGYDIIRRDGQRMIVVNETGKKLRKAFNWKSQGMKNEEIILKLKAMGVPMYKQQLSRLFRKPFYCGVMNHRMLEGKVIEGTQEKLITKELFFKVNNIHLKAPGNGVPHKKEDNNIPLKVFIKCDDCRQPFTGYIVKTKNLYYYKCRTNGCKCNRSAKKMHQLFTELLHSFTLNAEAANALQIRLTDVFYEKNKEGTDNIRLLNTRETETRKNIDAIEESYFIKKDMPRETYDKFTAKYHAEMANILKQKEQNAGSISNPENFIKEALIFASKLPVIWISGTISVREKLQKLIFPEGIYFNRQKEAFRTEKVNSVFAAIANAASPSSENKKETNQPHGDLSPLAETARFELAIELPLYTLSRRAPSTTRTRLRKTP